MLEKRLRAGVATMMLLAGPVAAQDTEGPHDAAIEARQSLMQVWAFDWALLNDMAKGKRPYDAEAAATAAASLVRSLGIDQSRMWPARFAQRGRWQRGEPLPPRDLGTTSRTTSRRTRRCAMRVTRWVPPPATDSTPSRTRC